MDLLYPMSCCGCKGKLPRGFAGPEGICPSCLSKITPNKPPFCHVCSRQISKSDIYKNVCSSCVRTPSHYDRAFSACVYDGVLKTLVHSFKYKDKEFLGKPLSRLMLDFIKEHDIPAGFMDCLIPVPLHNAKMREREYNQARVLCEHLGNALCKPVMDRNLFKCRATGTQTALERGQRIINVRGSFAVTEKSAVRGKNILLIDDVLTTGATASEAALALKSAGANIVFVLTLAS